MAASIVDVLSQVKRWTSPRLADASDAVLLEHFVQRRDESAFAALVARHGPMVLRSCRRVLGDAHEAEDAFQATFLILARKAHTLRQSEALPGFLHGIARRVALKARTKSAVRAGQTQLPDELPDIHPDPLSRLTARELLTVLDEEVQRLPAAQRSVIVLCCLEGHTHAEAAAILGWTAGSLKGHLERGRRRLHARLARRGIALSAVLAVVTISRGEAATALLQRSAVRAALGSGTNIQAVALAEGVLKGMVAGKLAGVTALVLTITVSASAVALVYRNPAAEPPDKNILPVPKAADAGKPERRADVQGDPLPPGAIARLGTVRFRQGDAIKRLTFTPDGKRLVSQGGDGIRIWDAATGQELRHLNSEKGLGYGDLSPDGKLVAVWGHIPENPPIELCSIELWDVDSGKKVGTLEVKCNTSSVYHRPIRFSPDGKLLATSSISESVHIWNLASRKILRSWQAHPRDVWNFAFSSDSRKLISCGSTGEFRLWDVTTGRQLQEFKPLDWKGISTELETALSPDGKLLALNESNEKHVSTAGKVEWKARISLRDTATGKLVRQLTYPAYEIIPGQQMPCRALTFTSDGKELITAGPDHFVRVWDANTGKELRRLPLDGLPASLALSKDGKKLAVVIYGGQAIQILDMSSGKTTAPAKGHLGRVNLAVLTPDGRTAVTSSWLGPLFVWDVRTGRVRRRLEGHGSPIVSLQLAEDGRTLFSSGWDNTFRVWDLSTGAERQRVKLDQDILRTGYGALVVAQSGKTLAVVSPPHTIRLLDTATGEERQSFQGPEGILGMGLTPDDRSLIAWSADFKVRIWDTATGRKLREYSLPQSKHSGNSHVWNYAALSPDGQLLAIDYYPGDEKQKCFLILKDLATGQVVHRIDKPPSYAGLVVAFSPDARTLAWTNSKEPSIHLLEVASGRERRRLAGHRGSITALAFSADGRRLLSGSQDTTALVWDLGWPGSRSATAAEMESLWTDLAAVDAARAYRAIRKLAASPTSSIPFLRKRLHPVAAVDEKRLSRLIADLDNDEFAIRQKAAMELAKLSDPPLSAYRKALESNPSLEMRRRLQELLEKAGPAWWDVSGERLRSLRAVETLELAGTTEARDVLKMLAGGAEGTRLTEQSKASLERLAKSARK